MMEQKSSLDQTSLESFFFQISYVPPGEYGGRHLLEACPRHVSVHALLAECDRPMPAVMCLTGSFNPRTPCGVRPSWERVSGPERGFQSTHSLRSATIFPRRPGGCRGFQSTHSLRSATQVQTWAGDKMQVSIHALLAECDPLPLLTYLGAHRFQSTHSLRSATAAHHRQTAQKTGFNPRTPCGVRRTTFDLMAVLEWFQSTHSLRSATPPTRGGEQTKIVSIHALLAECDCAPTGGSLRFCQFQSTHSLRSATYYSPDEWPHPWFQSTHSLRSATNPIFPISSTTTVSIHALLAECDGLSNLQRWLGPRFNPRTPCGVRPPYSR